VTSEAAAFGTPTITNNVGGMATSVEDNVSGIVLLPNSPPELYTQKILELFNNPHRYFDLCDSTRDRYERELNWQAASHRLAEIFHKVVKHENK
jgi:glycosyltransferase involved in cell wall biosynthesis